MARKPSGGRGRVVSAATAASSDDTLLSAGLLTLGECPPTESVVEALRKLGELADGCDDLTREALRAGAIRAVKPHGYRALAVDAVLPDTKSRDASVGAGTSISLANPEPWLDEVDGADLIGELVATFLRFVGLPEWAPVVLALWVLHSHAHDAADVSPLLALTSPEKRCGKSTTLHVLGALVPRPLPASNVTAPALFRAVEKFRPTLLVDEADTFLRNRDELRGVLNSGHARASAVVVRTAGDDHEARCFSTWSPKAVAMIGALPDTLADRSIILPMRRREPGEDLERLCMHRLPSLEPIRRRAWRWVCDNLDVLKAADPEAPSELHDRAADNWRPLLAIADLAGGNWPDLARDAARHMAGAEDGDDGSVATLLLRDIRELFTEREVDVLSSSTVADVLGKMEDRPWPEWGRSQKPITATALARKLKPFGIKPVQVRQGKTVSRSYKRADMEDAFRRYLDWGSTRDRCDSPTIAREDDGLPTRDTAKPVTPAPSLEKPLQAWDVTGVTGRRGGLPEENYELFERVAIQSEEFYSDPGDHR